MRRFMGLELRGCVKIRGRCLSGRRKGERVRRGTWLVGLEVRRCMEERMGSGENPEVWVWEWGDVGRMAAYCYSRTSCMRAMKFYIESAASIQAFICSAAQMCKQDPTFSTQRFIKSSYLLFSPSTDARFLIQLSNPPSTLAALLECSLPLSFHSHLKKCASSITIRKENTLSITHCQHPFSPPFLEEDKLTEQPHQHPILPGSKYTLYQ